MQNSELDESQSGLKIVGRNINNLRYVDDTTLMAESKEELRSLLLRVKVKNLAWNSIFKKTKIIAASPITSLQIDVEKWE